MPKGRYLPLCVFALLLPGFAVLEVQAQSAKAPDAYSVTEVVSLFGPAINMQVYRDGSQALVDQSSPPQQPGGKPGHTRTLYDLQAHTGISWNPEDNSAPCGKSTFSGDWGDPLAMSTEISGDLAKQHPAEVGTETINGIRTKVLQANTNDVASKVWVEAQSGFVVKVQMTPKNGPTKTMIEVQKVSFTRPAASVFALPSHCAATANAPRVMTESERIAAETGGNAQDFAKAILGPASKNSCSVVLRVVQAGSMQPITAGFQVAIDRTYDIEHPPSYSFGAGANGRTSFKGGGIQELTSQLRNGVLRIENAPPQFDIELAFGSAGSSSALIYRQCPNPETVLLFVVKNPAKLSDGGDWLWVKSGKYASVR